MARSVQIVLEDDFSGGLADETVSFALDGTAYEIDLSTKNAERLRSAFRPYVDKARKSRTRGQSPGRRSRSASAPTSNASEIRAWAQANGVPVSARGRITADVVAQYEAAHR